jgi:sugar lactone lactonase YvrE
MKTFTASAATPPQYELAEGVIWDDFHGLVRWVNIWAGEILSAILEAGLLTSITATRVGQTAGAVALAADGGILVAGARGLITISPEGIRTDGPDLLGDRVHVRFNDGAVDPHGRFIVGTVSLGEPTGGEQLLRISPDGTMEVLRSDVQLSNGIAWSPDGQTIYHVDTLARTVSSHPYDAGDFIDPAHWQTVLDDFPALPDGLTVDSEGMLWVAQWGGGCVLCYTPQGELLASVEVDATQVSCAGFVGPGLDTLAITTATEGLSHDTGDASGAIFVADVGVRGVPENRWRGSTRSPGWTHPRIQGRELEREITR